MVAIFAFILFSCFVYIHSFCLKLQGLSSVTPNRGISKHYPQQRPPQYEPYIGYKMQATSMLSTLIKPVNRMKASTYWDLYGRVPYDDWLFSTSHLANPDLLKRSFVEAVNQEIPIAIASFRRRMGIRSMFGTVTMIVPICLLLLYVSQRWHYSSNPLSRQFAREEAVRGFKTAIGALRKATGGDESKKKTTGRGTGDRRGSGRGGDEGEGEGDVPYKDLDGDRIIDNF